MESNSNDDGGALSHRWRFRRVGGVEQVVLESGADLLRLDTLDQKLWVALSCPTHGLEFDEKTLRLIDSDEDGRIRPPELIAALKWAGARLTTPDSLLSGDAALPLAEISEDSEGGKLLIAAARRILKSLGKGEAESISVEETSQAASLFAKLPFNGDGVAPPSVAEEPAIRTLMTEIVATVGGETDRSGELGVTAAKLGEFFREIDAFVSWWRAGVAESSSPDRLPLGERTPEGYQIFARVKDKIDDYFARCRLSDYDPRATSHVNQPEKDYADMAGKSLASLPEEMAARPLAMIDGTRPLLLGKGLNPAWEAAVEAFRREVIVPLLGDMHELREEDWLTIKQKFAVYESWLRAKQGASVEHLGLPRIEEIVLQNERAAVQALIERDLRRAGEAAALQNLDRLARFHRDLYKLTRNFVSFYYFFSRGERAIFQAGTLFLDSRSCDLCVQVSDPNAHAVLANLSRCFIAYCECRRPGVPAIKIAAVFSNGDSDNLMVGRNGVFYDRKGLDWDATIVRVVENPISIRQAFWAPYKKFARFVDEQLAKRAALADEVATQRMAGAAETTAHADRRGKPAEPLRKVDVGTVAAIGVALGSIGTFVTLILIRMIEFGPWLPFAFVGIVLVISCPSMFLAWLKLRQRTLGPILDANGWAINGRVKIGVGLARSLTGVQRLPQGAVRELPDSIDGGARKRRFLWLLAILAATLLAFAYVGYRNDWFSLPEAEPEGAGAEEAG